ncbi:hypothetical protein SEUCBS139899_010350 [Sporothrix eucalyptigena]|uniref:DUF7371 domain-containing protein n=1 Tax=Sporothrix eucalyptigena TaxID=1812306 RepID=A0ABP0CLV4_9PEZI
MRLDMQIVAVAAISLLPTTLAIPLSNTDSKSGPATSSISSGPSSYSYSSSSAESSASGSWSSFHKSVPSASASLQPYISSGPEPSVTVVVESFTIPFPHTTGPSMPAPTLSTLTATATVPLNSTNATVVHTFTITESAVHSASVTPFPSASISMNTSFSSAASKSLKSAASQESVIRSIFSDMGSSNSGLGPNLPHAKASTRPGDEHVPMSMITATFTLTMPTTTSTPPVPLFPTHSGSMITDKFTITVPPPPKTTTETSCSTSLSVWSSQETSCTTSTTSSCEETPTPSSSDNGVHTYTLTTEVTISLGPKTTSCANETSTPVPSGSDAITVTYTLPGGPGRASQTVTITTVRPQSTIAPGGSSSFLPSAPSSGIWSVGNSTTAGPTGTGSAFSSSSGFSWSVSGNSTSFHPTAPGTGKARTSSSTTHVVPSPGIVVITETKTYTQVSTAAPVVAKTTSHGVHPNGNITTIAGTGVPTPTGAGPHPFTNATESHGHGAAKPTHNTHFSHNMRRGADCERGANGGRMILNFDNVTMKTDKDRSAPNAQGFANPDQGLQFSGGFQRVVSSSSSLFVPSSPPAMLQYNQVAGNVAKIGAADSCSRFNLVSWNLGCDSTNAPCRFNVTGLRRAGGEEVASGSKVFVVPQASKSPGNSLRWVDFTLDEFSNLSSFTVQLEVDGVRTASWWSDDLSVARVCSGLSLCTELQPREASQVMANKVAEKPFWHKPGRVVN